MNAILLLCVAWLGGEPEGLPPGDHTRSVQLGDRQRTYLVHVPEKLDRQARCPVVLIFHGAAMNARMMVNFSGLNEKADAAGFVAVYPNGTGLTNAAKLFLHWNAGKGDGGGGQNQPDDVAFVSKLLDDLATVLNIDSERIYAAGMSNGAAMTYRLAAELSDRIAAIAPVGGTMLIDECSPKRAVPIIHFHGTADTFVPFAGSETPTRRPYKAVEQTLQLWSKLDGCRGEPVTVEVPNTANDGTTVTRTDYGLGTDGAEIELYTVFGGGHTWPGREPFMNFLGKSTMNISANDLIWEFFLKHPLRPAEQH